MAVGRDPKEKTMAKKPSDENGMSAGGKSGRGTPSPSGWKDRRGSDATAPLKKPVNNENGFGHTGRKSK
jgi:hypothetical protein